MLRHFKSIFSRQPKTKKHSTLVRSRSKAQRRLNVELLEDRTVPSSGFLAGTVYEGTGALGLTSSSTRLPGAIVSLYSATDTFITSTTTDANGNYLFTGLAPGEYNLVETPPSGFVNNGTQILSQLNPATAINSSTIQVTVLDPSALSTTVNTADFFSRNLWDYLQFTFDGSTQLNSAGQLPITVTGNDTVTSTPVSNQFLSLCWDLANVLQNGSNVYPVLPTSGQGLPIIAAAVSGGSVTITTSGPSGFLPGQSVGIAGVDGTGFDGAFIITGVSGDTFTYTDAAASGSSANNGTATVPNAAGQIAYLFNHYGTLDIQGTIATSTAGMIATQAGLPINATAEAAGLQVAIWELEYGSNFSSIVGIPPYTSAAEVAAINSYANFYISNSTGQNENAIFLEVSGPASPGSAGGEQGMLATGSYDFGNTPGLPSPSITTTQKPASATVGSPIADMATVSGGNNPTGTVTFNLYNNSTATGTPLFTDTETLSGGTATSAGYTPSATGTDYWVATYNGDSNNASVTSGTALEPVIITPATPMINTTQQPASATVGSSIADMATVSGGDNPTGTVTFNLYSNSTATGTPLFTDTEPLSGGMATSAGYAAGATGTDYWVATYNGDSNNSSVTSGTALEPVTITPATPMINTTQQPASATVGSPIADMATVSGGDSPTGTVTFNLYSNSTATGTPLFTDTEPLSGGMATSAGYTAGATGTDYWVATYNGDSNNSSVTSGTALEPVTITPATPMINTTQQPASATVGSPIADMATVSGGDSPTGTVTFNLYSNSTAIGTPLFTDTEPLSGGMATSAGYTAGATGTDYWVATYNGDSNNASVTSGTSLEPVTITKAGSSVSTTIKDSSGGPVTDALGEMVYDTATVSGTPFTPTGTVTYYFYNTASPVFGTTTPVSTQTVTLNSGAVPNSATTAALTAGSYAFVAVYSGDSNYAGYTGAVEPLTINKGSSSVSTTIKDASGGSCTSSLGEKVYDTATVSGTPFTPTGTVTYYFYDTASPVFGTTTPASTQTVTLSGGTVPNSATTGVLTAGGYAYIAVYSGDSNYTGYTGPVEPLTIGKLNSSVSTTIKDVSGGSCTSSLGEKVYDTATVGGTPFTPTGTVTYYFYDTASPVFGTTTPASTQTVTLSGGIVPNSATTGVLTAGGYAYIAVYSGDSNYNGATGPVEPLTIGKLNSSVSTTIKDVSGGSCTSSLGEKVYDTATVSGAPFTPTGTVTYYFYDTASPVFGTTTPASTQTVTLSSGTVPNSATTGVLTAGGYAYIAVYSGDSNYNGATGPVEPLTIGKLNSSVTTTIKDVSGGSCTSSLGEKVYDTATVSGTPFTPTGTVTYYFYNTTSPVFGTTMPTSTQTVTLSGGTVPNSTTTGVLTAGGYAYIAVYSGDSNYNGATGPVESLTIGKLNSSVSTTIKDSTGCAPTDVVGEKVYDTATVTGVTGVTPTGTLTYYFYKTSTPIYGTTTPTSTQTVTLSGGNAPNSATTAALTAGSYAYIGVYSGDSNYTGYTGTVEPLAVGSGTITGIKYLDKTGNGFSSDDAGLGGVTIDLYNNASGSGALCSGDALVATTTTSTTSGQVGAYSFTGLAPGTYFVQEVVPSGYIQTGGGPNGSAGSTYYTVTITAGQSSTGNNFDDYQIPTCTPTCVSFAITCTTGSTTTVTNLRGSTTQGEEVTVTFTVTPGMTDQLTLISYTAPSATFSSNTAYQQVIYDEATGTFAPGTHTLTVLIPNCYYQIDFVCGPAITPLGPTTYAGNSYGPDSANIFYTAQNRLISADNGGTNACSTSQAPATGHFGAVSLWSNSTGQALIKAFNGSASATQLAQWLATSFPNLYGASAGSGHSTVNSNGTYFTNAQVAAAYANFTGDAQQVLSAALSLYATSSLLEGASAAAVAKADHLSVTADGSANDNYTVGANGAAFGVANNTTMTIMQLLEDLNASTVAGAAVNSGAGTVFGLVLAAGGNLTN